MTLTIIVLILLLIVATYVGLIMPRCFDKPNIAPFLTDYAHRGLFNNKNLPENSLGAFENAVRHGFAIELDLQLSSDGEVMVFHDYTLDRVCGVKGKLAKHTAKQLSQCHLLGTQYTIPTFAEVLKLVDGRVPLLIELKGEDINDDLCWKVAPMLDAYEGDYCVESFNPFLLQWFKKHRPEVARGQLVTNLRETKKDGNKYVNFFLTYMLLNCLSRPDFIACDENYTTGLAHWVCRNVFRAPYVLWTVRKIENMNRNRAMGATSIFEGFTPVRRKK